IAVAIANGLQVEPRRRAARHIREVGAEGEAPPGIATVGLELVAMVVRKISVVAKVARWVVPEQTDLVNRGAGQPGQRPGDARAPIGRRASRNDEVEAVVTAEGLLGRAVGVDAAETRIPVSDIVPAIE